MKDILNKMGWTLIGFGAFMICILLTLNFTNLTEQRGESKALPFYYVIMIVMIICGALLRVLKNKI
jgi:hypothetical protein